jgi:hypothetical protein
MSVTKTKPTKVEKAFQDLLGWSPQGCTATLNPRVSLPGAIVAPGYLKGKRRT